MSFIYQTNLGYGFKHTLTLESMNALREGLNLAPVEKVDRNSVYELYEAFPHSKNITLVMYNSETAPTEDHIIAILLKKTYIFFDPQSGWVEHPPRVLKTPAHIPAELTEFASGLGETDIGWGFFNQVS